jgi:hypothetical protein
MPFSPSPSILRGPRNLSAQNRRTWRKWHRDHGSRIDTDCRRRELRGTAVWSNPRGRMIGDVDVQNAARTNFHRDEHIEHAKRRSDRDQEIASDNRLCMVSYECCPTLITSPATWRARTQILSHRSRRNTDSEFDEQLIGDALLSPSWILAFQFTNDFPKVLRKRRTPAPSGLPSPELAERVAMPSQESCRLDDDQRATPIKESSQSHHRQPKCTSCSSRSRLSLLEKCELFAKEQVLGHQGGAGEKEQAKEGEQYGFYAISIPFQG